VLRGLAAYRWSLEQLEDAVLQQNWSQLALELRRTQTLRPDFLTAPGEVNSES
ncbi:MAG: arogenate dehydrogenase, partial [Cyanobacteriota bacterium]|nr:arogenate dehydrogenase [Cyanobacteriota bacterium]